jgi:hypothetical protein
MSRMMTGKAGQAGREVKSEKQNKKILDVNIGLF